MRGKIKLNILPSVNRLVAKEIIKYIDWLKERYKWAYPDIKFQQRAECEAKILLQFY